MRKLCGESDGASSAIRGIYIQCNLITGRNGNRFASNRIALVTVMCIAIFSSSIVVQCVSPVLAGHRDGQLAVALSCPNVVVVVGVFIANRCSVFTNHQGCRIAYVTCGVSERRGCALLSSDHKHRGSTPACFQAGNGDNTLDCRIFSPVVSGSARTSDGDGHTIYIISCIVVCASSQCILGSGKQHNRIVLTAGGMRKLCGESNIRFALIRSIHCDHDCLVKGNLNNCFRCGLFRSACALRNYFILAVINNICPVVAGHCDGQLAVARSCPIIICIIRAARGSIAGLTIHSDLVHQADIRQGNSVISSNGCVRSGDSSVTGFSENGQGYHR